MYRMPPPVRGKAPTASGWPQWVQGSRWPRALEAPARLQRLPLAQGRVLGQLQAFRSQQTRQETEAGNRGPGVCGQGRGRALG